MTAVVERFLMEAMVVMFEDLLEVLPDALILHQGYTSIQWTTVKLAVIQTPHFPPDQRKDA